MPLKDLIAAKSALTEEAIEAIVRDYVRYDIEEMEIVLTPAALQLPGKAKVLVYLVALQGWPVVAGEAIATDAKPANIEARVGVPGGTLRPILKDLKDRHLIVAKSGAYSVRSASLGAIKAELGGGATTKGSKPRRGARKRIRANDAHMDQEAVSPRGRRKSLAGTTGNLTEKFDAWIDEGFFIQPRSLADVQERFHQEGDIIPQTSVPKYLLRAVRRQRLSREKAKVGNKIVWIYKTKK